MKKNQGNVGDVYGRSRRKQRNASVSSVVDRSLRVGRRLCVGGCWRWRAAWLLPLLLMITSVLGQSRLTADDTVCDAVH